MNSSPEYCSGFWDPVMDLHRKQVVLDSVQLICDRLPNPVYARLLEATTASYDSIKRRVFTCERSVAYVIGRVPSLESPWGENHYSTVDKLPAQWRNEYFQPTYDELIKLFPVLNGPKFMAIAALRGERETNGYHLGLVLDDMGQMIWSKMGQLRADICPESFLKPVKGNVTYLSSGI